MYLRFKILISFSIIVFIIAACGGDDGLDGSLTVVEGLEQKSVVIRGVVGADGSVSNTAELSFDRPFEQDDLARYEVTPSTSSAKLVLDISTPEAEGVTQIVFLAGANGLRVSSDGTLFTFDLNEGINLIVLRNIDDKTRQWREYQFVVKRISTSSMLSGLNLVGLPVINNTNVLKAVNDAFRPDTFEYSATIPFDQCTLQLTGLRPQSTFSKVKINGEVVRDVRQSRFIELLVGTNTLVVDVESEDGSSTNTYTYTINRSEPTAEETENNRTLSQLTFDSAELLSVQISNEVTNGFSGFHCVGARFLLRINNDVDKLVLGAAPSIAGKTVQAGKLVSTGSGANEVNKLENPVTITIEDPREFAIAVGEGDVNKLAVVVLNNDGEVPMDGNGSILGFYELSVIRSATNHRSPKTGEELQSVLQNAMPGDDIILDAKTYIAPSTEDKSGKNGVVFYSAASGTKEKPIRLRGVSGSILSTGNVEKDIALQLSGDFWLVDNIGIEKSAQALVLDAASDNVIARLSVNNIGMKGLELRNGSNRNIFSQIRVDNIGVLDGLAGDNGEAIVIGSAPDQWKIATTPGPFEHVNDDNSIQNSVFGPEVKGELIDIKPGNTGTTIRQSAFNATGVTALATQGSAILNSGNDTLLEYSTFVHKNPPLLSAVVVNSDVDFAWVTEAWGENAKIYDNHFDLNGKTESKIVSALEGVDAVSVEDNRRDDGVDVSFDSTNITTNSPIRLFQIQSVDVENMCVRRATVARTAGGITADRELLVEATCENVPDEYWEVIHEANLDVVIRGLNKDGDAMISVDRGNFRNVVNVRTPATEVRFLPNQRLSWIELLPKGDILDQSNVIRWFIRHLQNDEVNIVNAFDPRYRLSLVDLTEDFETVKKDQRGLVIEGQMDVPRQRFKLVPVQP